VTCGCLGRLQVEVEVAERLLLETLAEQRRAGMVACHDEQLIAPDVQRGDEPVGGRGVALRINRLTADSDPGTVSS
jgi:hypothetical protein